MTGEPVYDIYTDGGARGNPGPAGIGIVLKRRKVTVAKIFERIGETTNNQAEYRAVLRALEEAHTIGARRLRFHLDSELVVSQLRKEYKVKDQHLAKLFVQVWNAAQKFAKVEYHWIPRSENREADALVNQALDQSL